MKGLGKEMMFPRSYSVRGRVPQSHPRRREKRRWRKSGKEIYHRCPRPQERKPERLILKWSKRPHSSAHRKSILPTRQAYIPQPLASLARRVSVPMTLPARIILFAAQASIPLHLTLPGTLRLMPRSHQLVGKNKARVLWYTREKTGLVSGTGVT